MYLFLASSCIYWVFAKYKYMQRDDMQKLGDVYGSVLNKMKYDLMQESKTKQPPNAFNSEFKKQEGGLPDGANKALNDKGGDTCDCDGPCACGDNCDCEGPCDCEKKSTRNKKIVKESLNNRMARKTLSFDNLFKSIIRENFGAEMEENDSDVAGLGLDDATPDDDMFGDDDMGGDEITVSVGGIKLMLSRSDAEALQSDISAQLEGGDDDMGDEDLDFADEGDDDSDMDFDAEEAEEVPSKLVGKDNKVGKVRPKGGKASSAVTDDCSTDDNGFGHALHGAKQPNMGTGSGNKVGKLKAGNELFQ
jgi:hypothetical protein